MKIPGDRAACFIGLGSGAMTPLVRLARSKVIGSVGIPCDGDGRAGGTTPIVPTAMGTGPHSFLARRVLVTDSATGVTRLMTGRVCGVHRDGGTLLHNRTSGAPSSNTRLGVVLSGLGTRRSTVAGVFSNAHSGRRGAFAVQLAPSGRLGGRITFHFSGGLKMITGGSLTNAPFCVALGSLGAIGVPRSSKGGGGRPRKVTCGIPKRTRVALASNGGGLCRKRMPMARFNVVRCLTPMLFGGGSAVGICFSPGANKLLGMSQRRKGW